TVDVAAARSANDERRWGVPTIMRFGNHINDLVESAADEIHELEFSDRSQTGQRGAKGGPNDGGFGNRCVDDALRAEAVDEALGDLEGATVDADVFAKAEHGRVTLHFFPDPLADGFEISELRHCSIPA